MKPLLYLLLSLVLSTNLWAQEKKVSLKIRTLCVKKHKNIDRMTIHLPKDKSLSVELFDDSFSKEVEYHGPPAMMLSFADQPPFTVNIPDEMKNAVLLMIPQSTAKARPYRVVVVNNSLTNFPYGTRKLINLTKNKIALKTPNKNVIVAPYKELHLKLDKQKVGAERFPVQFYVLAEQSWRLFSSTRWSIDKTKRTYVFIYKKPNTKRYTYHSIPDYYVDKEAVAAAFKKGSKEDTKEREKVKNPIENDDAQ